MAATHGYWALEVLIVQTEMYHKSKTHVGFQKTYQNYLIKICILIICLNDNILDVLGENKICYQS